MKKTEQRKKGQLGTHPLSLSKAYLIPGSRNRALVLGGLAAIVVLSIASLSYFYFDHGFFSNGPLSSHHAQFESECASCHGDSGKVEDAKCTTCHEKFGDQLGVFSQAAHFLYQSDDFERIQEHEIEAPCYSCHPEHRGREAVITHSNDRFCVSCHDFGSFNLNHPAMAYSAEVPDDNDNLKFPHAHHVSELMERRGWDDLEKACLFCHNPEPDGRNFKPLNFDEHCDQCHLTASSKTLPLADPQNPGPESLGVKTPQAIQAQGGPNTGWAQRINPANYRLRDRGNIIVKSPLEHKDPWVLQNLAYLRQIRYPDQGLIGLLKTSATLPPDQIKALYWEALATLEEQAKELGARPEPQVRRELEQVYQVLDQIRNRLKNPYTALDQTKFLPELLVENPDLTEAQWEELNQLESDLTESCRECHYIEDGMIARVDQTQRILKKAKFNHRAHIIQRRCTDCHNVIPVAAAIQTGKPLSEEEDWSGIQNLPEMDNCRECHAPNLVSNQCITCHDFHPHKERRSDLLLYLD